MSNQPRSVSETFVELLLQVHRVDMVEACLKMTQLEIFVSYLLAGNDIKTSADLDLRGDCKSSQAFSM